MWSSPSAARGVELSKSEFHVVENASEGGGQPERIASG